MDTDTTLPAAGATVAYDGALTCALNVTDLDRAIAWYGAVLGMELAYRVDEIAWAELVSPVSRVTLGLSQVEQVPAGGGTTLTFGVVDIHAAKAVLDAAGVRQDGDIQTIPGIASLITFFDPDGNAFMFAQDLNPAS